MALGHRVWRVLDRCLACRAFAGVCVGGVDRLALVDLAGEVVREDVEDLPEIGVVGFCWAGVVEVPHVVAAPAPCGSTLMMQ